tara:strand:- start:156 stop:308 length:153 start_codon:yes stop_codon:yes gene_type:complete
MMAFDAQLKAPAIAGAFLFMRQEGARCRRHDRNTALDQSELISATKQATQ